MASRELVTPEVYAGESFAEVLETFADAAQQYDFLREGLRAFEHDSFTAAHKERLAYIDIHLPYDEHPEILARSALALYLHSQHVEDAQDRIRQLEESCDELTKRVNTLYRGRKVTVTAINDSASIGTSKQNPYGYYDGKSRWHRQITGRVHSVSFSLLSGGGIGIKQRRGSKKLYSTGSLISRDNYEPLYSIQFLQ